MRNSDDLPDPSAASIDAAETRKFADLADRWWDRSGPFKPLHELNAARLRPIIEAIERRWPRPDTGNGRPLEGLRILDVGCGGGLAAEPLARLGAEVTGIDVVQRNISIARIHAQKSGLAIDYRFEAAEALATRGQRFDVVLGLEVVEHVADLDSFMGALCRLVHPGGLLFVATLNRTIQSYLFGILGAEYLLGLVPRGTHRWRRFRKPDELHAILRRHGLAVERLQGMSYAPFGAERWRLSHSLAVNYLLRAARPA
ncbi:bifunctional 2-polyprenyl-6-hydroxyphenol methylase/3-demethylubiquinol 3-O-methyltransferase UbiG [Alphaproteobacteria bacterium LMG 31809]|uniref:Ubiquinone biosynthesis O-methyltransferase n=2 Tax=Govanella unica TaxID=2975056 RepID=A0A9X3TWM8_9PROT|nr:bifunctional 2-polyprenyl-6-hydroxyphenol methylase/3-demethylubiquinol 3-O-methyltransferase UbiG [Govania unica]